MIGGKKQKSISKDHKLAARALERLFAMGYVSRRALYIENFIRGIFFSAGGVIGATIVIALIAWLLSFFNTIPLIGPLFREAQQSLQQTK